MPFDISTAKPVQQQAAPIETIFDPTTAKPATAPGTQEQILSSARKLDVGIEQYVPDAVSEAMAAVNRGIVNLADFMTVDQVNNILEVIGSDKRVPTLSEQPIVQAATTGGIMEPGLGREMIRTGGEMMAPGAMMGGVMRKTAQALPKLAPSVESTTAGVVRQMGAGTAPGDITLSAISGAGTEVGRETGGETGALIGAVLAPTSAIGAKTAFTKLLGAGKSGIESFMRSTADMTEEGASTLLAESMVREGLSPDDITKRMADLGPEAMPADIGTSFARLLRLASNKIPRIEGQVSDVFSARHAGQGNRVLSALDDATGTSSLTMDDEIARLDKTLGPQIRDMYAAAGEKGLRLSEKLRKLLEGKSDLGKAREAADIRLANKRAMGDTISNIDVINATKQELDDRIGVAIRAGEKHKVRDLVRLKNAMVDEADESIPEYKQARSLFAGKASLENAADSGLMFLKMKPRDMEALTRTFGESEKRMFKLGAKQAVLDKIDDISTSADAIKRLFGKNGDIKKLRYLFDDDASFKQFSDTLKRETDFVLTRRAAQENSTTFKQASDEMMAAEILRNTNEAISSPMGAANALGRILGGLSSKKGSELNIKALEEAGDILLSKGMDPTRLQALLRRGNAQHIEEALRKSLKPNLTAPYVAPITTSVIVEETN